MSNAVPSGFITPLLSYNYYIVVALNDLETIRL